MHAPRSPILPLLPVLPRLTLSPPLLTERLFDAKKQKLLLAFTGECRGQEQAPGSGAGEPPVELVAPPPSADVVRYSSGDKCCVKVEEVSESSVIMCVCACAMCVHPLQSWGAVHVHNAMVLSVAEDSDMVRLVG